MPAHNDYPSENFNSDFTDLAAAAVTLLADEEGFRPKPYLCSEGFPTVGYGQRIGAKNQPLIAYQFSLPEVVARRWLAVSVATLINDVSQHPKIEVAFYRCNLARQTVLISMAYQLGVNGLVGFKNMLTAIKDEHWKAAEAHALDSLWARMQTPSRALRHARVLATGKMDAN
mgnify:CR=1 FL=1